MLTTPTKDSPVTCGELIDYLHENKVDEITLPTSGLEEIIAHWNWITSIIVKNRLIVLKSSLSATAEPIEVKELLGILHKLPKKYLLAISIDGTVYTFDAYRTFFQTAGDGQKIINLYLAYPRSSLATVCSEKSFGL